MLCCACLQQVWSSSLVGSNRALTKTQRSGLQLASYSSAWALCPDHVWFAKGNTLVFFWRLQLCKPRLYSFKGHMLAPWYWCVRCTLHVYCMCKLALTCTTDLVYKTLETGQTLFQKGRKKGGRGRCMHGIRVLQFSILLDVLDE